jgi:hypothetical protein
MQALSAQRAVAARGVFRLSGYPAAPATMAEGIAHGK